MSNDKNTPSYSQKMISEEERKLQIITETINDLRTNEKYKAYFSKYHPQSVDMFIEGVARLKSSFIIHGPMYRDLYFKRIHKFVDAAKEYFTIIQQYKLFRLQFLWNEGKISIPGIESNYDFYNLYKNIFEFTHLPPVALEEVEAMKEFIITRDDIDNSMYCNFHSTIEHMTVLAEEFKNDGEDDVLTYHFFVQEYFGLSPLSYKSLIKASKEEHYLRIALKKEQENRVIPTPQPIKDSRPRLEYYNNGFIRNFISKYEDQKLLHAFDAMERDAHNDEMYDDVQKAMWHLQETKEQHSLEQNADWRIALIEAAQKSKKKKTADALSIVFEEYKNALEANTPYKTNLKDNGIYYETFASERKQQILDGRKILGEPEDFNF